MRCTCIFRRPVCICASPAKAAAVADAGRVMLGGYAPTLAPQCASNSASTARNSSADAARFSITTPATVDRRSMHASARARLDARQT